MTETCPYCDEELADVVELGRHAMASHRAAVRAHLVRTGSVSSFTSGQQTLTGQVVA